MIRIGLVLVVTTTAVVAQSVTIREQGARPFGGTVLGDPAKGSLHCDHGYVEWQIPGAFHTRGKDAFDGQIENDAFVGHPAIAVTRLIEEGDVVVAEGSVRTQKKDGAFVNLAFCDVFEMRSARIRRLISYLMEVL